MNQMDTMIDMELDTTKLSWAEAEMQKFFGIANPSEEEKQAFIKAMEYLIEATNDPAYMTCLGANYYGWRQFDLALKYYEMADELGYLDATIDLGYIWYYGRTGRVDYEKAFKCFDKGRKAGDVVAAYKVADMYKNGYYVEADYEEYKRIIKEIAVYAEDMTAVEEPVPEIFTRLARIYIEEGRDHDALELLLYAKHFLAQRIRWNPFFGNLSIMKHLLADLYTLVDLDYEYLDFYDLYMVLNRPVRVRFCCDDETYEIEAAEKDGRLVIMFGGKSYKSIDEFFERAEIDKQLLTSIYYKLDEFKVCA